jgi:DNA mismatch repair ATPase MutL
LKAHHFQFQFE